MANWKMTIKIKDLLTEDDSDECAQYVGKEIAKRLNESGARERLWLDDYEMMKFDDIVEGFMYGVVTCDDVNGFLDELYDFGDYGHRIWFD